MGIPCRFHTIRWIVASHSIRAAVSGATAGQQFIGGGCCQVVVLRNATGIRQPVHVSVDRIGDRFESDRVEDTLDMAHSIGIGPHLP